MKTEKTFKREKSQNLLNFVTIKELYEKSTLLNIEADAFDSVDLFNIFLRFLGFL